MLFALQPDILRKEYFQHELRITTKQFPHKIQKIDFFRYLAVYHYGGVYMDLDILLHKSLDSIIGDPNLCKFPIELKNINDTIITRNDFYSLIGNYAFYAPPKHPFIKKLIDNIASGRITMDDIKLAQSTNGDPDDQVEVYCTTGPIMVTQTYIDYKDKKQIHILDK